MSARHNLVDDDISKTLIRLTGPMIIGMFMLFSFNLVDTFFIGLLGTEPLSAVSFTFPVTFTLLSLAIGMGIGTSAVVGKYMGRGDHDKARDASTVTSYISMGLALLLSVTASLFLDPIFLALGASESLLPEIRQYMIVWLPTSVLIVGMMTANAVLRACGDTRTPSYVMAGAGLINVILDPLLIFGIGPFPALGIQGAAIATAISWLAGFLYIYRRLLRHSLIYPGFPAARVFRQSGGEMLRIGVPASGANMLTPLAAGIMTAIVASYGETAVAGFGVGSRLESIATLLVLALSTTLPPFISQNFGAGRMDRVRDAYRLALKFVLLWQLLVYVVMALASPLIALIFTRDPQVTETIQLYLWILPLGYGLQGVIILTNSSLNALHKPMFALYLSIIRFFVFYVPMAWVGSQLFGLPGFFGGAFVGNLLMAGVAWQTFNRLLPPEPLPVGACPAGEQP